MSMRGGGMGGSAGMLRQGMLRSGEVGKHRLGRGVVRRVLGFAVPLRGLITVFLITVVATAVLGVVPPLLFREIIDTGVLAGDRTRVIVLASVVAGLAIVEAGVGLVSRWLSSRIGEGLILQLRTQVFDHVLRMPLSFFTRAQTGKLVTRLNSDVIGAQQAFTSTLSTMVSNVISLVLVMIAMLVLSWPLTVAALVLLPIFLLPARLVGRRLADLTRQGMQLNADMGAVMTERFSVSGALLVKLFGRSAEEHAGFADRAGQVRDVQVRIALNGRFLFTALTLVAALATALVYGFGGLLSIDGALTVGTLTALAGLLVRLYGPLTQLTNLRVDIMSALISFERVFEILDLDPTITDAVDARPVSGTASITFENVGFAYPGASAVSLASLEVAAPHHEEGEPDPVLIDVSFAVEPGQTVALVGPSGSGKTTITHLIARLYDVTAGRVLVGGDDVRELRQDSLSGSIGYVTQDAHLFHDTMRANLTYARPGATDAQMLDALRAAQIGDLVARLPDGLDTVVGDRGYRLSGGERQRLAIARMLLKAPPIVVLDEATAHLDTESEFAVQRALDQAMAGRTSVVVAHRLSTVRHADQILVIRGGRIVERGDHRSLLAAGGLYAELVATQFAGQGDGGQAEAAGENSSDNET